MKKPDNAKERNLLKGAIRRVFSRSELRKQAIDAYSIEHFEANRPRVKKWVFCSSCGLIFPKYLAQVDHVLPMIPVSRTLEQMTWDEVIEAAWCDITNLKVMDKDCHKEKTKAENKLRREHKSNGKKT